MQTEKAYSVAHNGNHCELRWINNYDKQDRHNDFGYEGKYRHITNEIKAGTPTVIVPWLRTLKTLAQTDCSLSASTHYPRDGMP